MKSENANDWILSFDGGGSKIAAAAQSAVANAILPTSLDNARTWTFSGTGSAHVGTWSAAQEHLGHAVRVVTSELPDGNRALRHVVFALAGAGRKEDSDRVVAWARNLPELKACASIQCVGDIEPMIDYSRCEHGTMSIAVILGTGSIVAARDQHGHIIRAGGWGPNLGDECSGGALGVAALRKVVQWFDTADSLGAASVLVREVVKALTPTVDGLDGEDSAIDRAALATALINTAADRTAAAALAHRVINLALERRDADAVELLRPQLNQLVWQIEQVTRRAFKRTAGSEAAAEFELIMAGGLAAHHPALRQAIADKCTARGCHPIRMIVAEPLLAALRFAVTSSPKFDEAKGNTHSAPPNF